MIDHLFNLHLFNFPKDISRNVSIPAGYIGRGAGGPFGRRKGAKNAEPKQANFNYIMENGNDGVLQVSTN